MNYKITGIIYIGSSEIYLKICQKFGEEIKVLDKFIHHIQIGKQAYEVGRIDNDKVDLIIGYLNKYSKLCEEYGVEKIELLASTAIRESKNRDLIKGRIYRETDMNLNILSDEELKNIVFMSIYTLIKDQKYIKEDSIISFIGTGNIGISFYIDEKIRFLQNILIGTLKLYDISKNAEKYSDKTHLLIKEQIEMYTKFLPNFSPNNNSKFIITGRMMETILNSCPNLKNKDFYVIKKEDFEALYESLIDVNVEKISIKYSMNQEYAREFLIAVVIIENLLNISNFNEILVPRIHYFDILYYKYMDNKEYNRVEEKFREFTISTAKNISKNYNSLDKHIKYVNIISKKIVNKLDKDFKFTEKEKLYLELAVILHNIGKFINPDKHYFNTSYIIRNTDIIGLNEREKHIISLITKYQSILIPDEEDNEFNQLDYREKMIVSKLSVILRIADSLDKNYRQKFKNVKLRRYKKNIKFMLETNENSSIENMKFDEYKKYFKEVFGINLSIEIRRVY